MGPTRRRVAVLVVVVFTAVTASVGAALLFLGNDWSVGFSFRS
jgi:hypothetical protein